MARSILTVACTLAFSLFARADITLLGSCSFPGDALDKSGLTNPITDTIPHNLLGSFGSAIDFTGKDDLYIALNDRGPSDGKLPFRPRFQTIRITIDPAAASPTPTVSATLISTALLSTESGDPFTGLSSAFSSTDQKRSCRFDPRGHPPLRHQHDSHFRRVRPLDRRVLQWRQATEPLRNPGTISHRHTRRRPHRGVRAQHLGGAPNKGFEGLAISPDKSKCWAIVQGPLIQDSLPEADGSRKGVNCRILELTLATGATREFVYQLDRAKHGVSELLAISDHELLVLERDGGARKFRSLYRIDLSKASDVSDIVALPSTTLPPSITPVSKSRWLDLCDPRFVLAANMPEKIEGLAFGPTLPDGRRTLIVTSDNDLKPDQPTWIWVFACEPADLGIAESRPTSDLTPPSGPKPVTRR